MPGRGGAGNILAVQQESERAAADTEAGQRAAETYLDGTPFRADQKYAHLGRGGAGNYYSPKALTENGVYKDNDLRQTIGDGVNTLGSGPTIPFRGERGAPEAPRTYGRGGAGNSAFDTSENQEKALQKRLEEEEQKRAKLQADIEQGVHDILAVPPKAKLPGP